MVDRCTQSFAQLSHPVGRDHKHHPSPKKALTKRRARRNRNHAQPIRSELLPPGHAYPAHSFDCKIATSMATQLIPDHPLPSLTK